MDWTYNYAYFGERPEVNEAPDSTEGTLPADPVGSDSTENTNTVTDTTTGCKSTLSLAPIVSVIAFATAAVVMKKKEN